MGADAYEILALCMRYVFAALMLLIVLRAWRITAADSARAAKLRRLSPQTGIIGELLVTDGSERVFGGTRYRVILEGSIGSSRRCDVRIRHSSVFPRHALFQMTDDGLFVRACTVAPIADGHGHRQKELLLRDGDLLFIGNVRLMLILSEADETPEELDRPRRHRPAREPSEARPPQNAPDDLFFSNPAAARRTDDDYDAENRRDGYDEHDAESIRDGYDEYDAESSRDGYDEYDHDGYDDYDTDSYDDYDGSSDEDPYDDEY